VRAPSGMGMILLATTNIVRSCFCATANKCRDLSGHLRGGLVRGSLHMSSDLHIFLRLHSAPSQLQLSAVAVSGVHPESLQVSSGSPNLAGASVPSHMNVAVCDPSDLKRTSDGSKIESFSKLKLSHLLIRSDANFHRSLHSSKELYYIKRVLTLEPALCVPAQCSPVVPEQPVSAGSPSSPHLGQYALLL